MPSVPSEKSAVTIALVEDDRPYRNYVAALLSSVAGWRVTLEAGSVEEASRLGGKLRPRVLLLDIMLPGLQRSAAVRHFLALWPDVNVVMLTGHDSDELVLEAIKAGAMGYILKGASSDEIQDAVSSIISGGSPMSPAIARKVLSILRTAQPMNSAPAADGAPALTTREQEVVALVADGLSDKEIAARLNTAVPTVKNQLASVYSKWRIHSRAGAAARFVRKG